jgi:type VI secretion system secreted protein Hcp
MKTFTSLLAAVFTACSLTASSFAESFSIFLKIDPAVSLTVQGESTAPNHVGEIDVASFKAGVLQKGTTFAGSGVSAGKAELTPLTIFKFLDKASPSLFVACVTGVHFPKATLFIENAAPPQGALAAAPPDRPPGEFFRIELKDVVITSLNQNADTTDSNGNLVETVTLSYTEIRWTYTPATAAGGAGTPVTGGFNVKTNKKL